MIDDLTRERILDAANIVEVVSDFVSLRKRGVNYLGLCPFHSDRNPSFSVSPAKNLCKCFACGEGGSPVHFIMKIEQLSYSEALRYLARKYGIEIHERELTDEEKRLKSDRESMFILNEFANDFFKNNLLNTIEGQTIGMTYFRQRGIRPETVQKFHLGYAPEKRSAFSDEAIRKGFKPEYLVDTGLSIRYEDSKALDDRFRGRVIFPVQTVSGKIVAFGGRILGKKGKAAKYVNSPESIIYSKSKELYGLFLAKKEIARRDKCFLVEGYTDVISMHQSGIENVVASSGTALTQQQINQIHRFTSNITVLYDGDAAGIKAALRGINLLLEQGMHVKVVLLPDGEDPDSFARNHTVTEFEEYIEQHETDFIRFKTQLYLSDMERDPIRRAQLISDIIGSIALIPDDITRRVYVQETGQTLSMDERLLAREVQKMRFRRSTYSSPHPPTQQPANGSGRKNDSDNLVGTENHSAETPTDNRSAEVGQPYYPAKYEEELLRLIIRYGERKLLIYRHEEGAEKQTPSEVALAYYIKSDLNADGVDIGTDVFRQILDEAAEQSFDSGFVAAKYFRDHPNAQISHIAVELLTNRYALSRIHYGKGDESNAEEDLQMRVERELLTIKNVFIQVQIRALQKEIAQAQKAGDIELQLEIMNELRSMNEMKSELAHRLGDRTVLP
ncbi:DNA primase [Porphyromonas gingivalis]|uniref:DNA primase n=1 Tax=Porphyromonas gingivalis TaxID=837 RepID=UPI001F41E797|nr:DNA primase [Porphyromonas gingivalis]MCE8165203.1 DNA primase [Porphyromonas gingivalis]